MSVLKIKTAQVFQPLLQPARYKGAYGGRGSGKSHFMAELTIEEHLMYPGLRTMCIREVQRSIRDSIRQLLIDKIKSMNVQQHFEVVQAEIRTPGNGRIIFEGMQDHNADTIKSFEGFNRSLCEESNNLSQKSLELLRPTIRNAGPAPMAERRFIWNPGLASDPIERLLRGLNPPDGAIVINANYDSNPWFPDDMQAERMHDKIHYPDRYAHIWLGHFEPQAVGAIWNRQNIIDGRLSKMHCERERTTINIDPAVSDTATSDMHGITVTALGEDGRGYLLEDGSMNGSPHQWASRAVALFDKWDADSIVIEKNQGGDMCRHTIETVRKHIPITLVQATRGKHVRAEPISALYNLGRISHIGTFPELESQLCLFTSSGYEGKDSPDRAESMIWGFTQLFNQITRERARPEIKVHRELYGSGGRQQTDGGWMG